MHNQVGPAQERVATYSSSADDSVIKEKDKEIRELKDRLKKVKLLKGSYCQ